MTNSPYGSKVSSGIFLCYLNNLLLSEALEFLTLHSICLPLRVGSQRFEVSLATNQQTQEKFAYGSQAKRLAILKVFHKDCIFDLLSTRTN